MAGNETRGCRGERGREARCTTTTASLQIYSNARLRLVRSSTGYPSSNISQLSNNRFRSLCINTKLFITPTCFIFSSFRGMPTPIRYATLQMHCLENGQTYNLLPHQSLEISSLCHNVHRNQKRKLCRHCDEQQSVPCPFLPTLFPTPTYRSYLRCGPTYQSSIYDAGTMFVFQARSRRRRWLGVVSWRRYVPPFAT
jgi:hypothetical protein